MDQKQAQEREQSMETANQPGIYKTILVGVLVSILGVYLRFAFDAIWLSILSWVILFVGAFICCKAVFKILDAK
ncbi:hypothetical protein [Pedobacter sp. ASV12]|uniref:hypothetical protein n=1 Tax=Pedobacter sp. ASV12 TaxID=2795120 RepID=UPI0018EA6087|nr:hypothetical protein [Pedobacter sp. ASV12]